MEWLFLSCCNPDWRRKTCLIIVRLLLKYMYGFSKTVTINGSNFFHKKGIDYPVLNWIQTHSTKQL